MVKTLFFLECQLVMTSFNSIKMVPSSNPKIVYEVSFLK